MASNRLKIFYVADIHGSERCFRKWLNAAGAYRADVIIFGGDLAGKVLQPIVRTGASHHETEIYGEFLAADSEAELAAIQARIRNAGRYDLVVSPDEKQGLDDSSALVHETFVRVARESAMRWLNMADERLRQVGVPAYMMLGNDDFREMQDVFGQAELVVNPEGRVVELAGGFEMISLGYSNPTPWNSPRELTEAELSERILAMAEQLRDPANAIFNLHVPPQGTQLDRAPLLDHEFRPIVQGGQMLIGNVGSDAVRKAIERFQPMLGLHGHIHESSGMSKIGRTVSINPGSEYVDGILRGALVTIEKGKGVRGWQLVNG